MLDSFSFVKLQAKVCSFSRKRTPTQLFFFDLCETFQKRYFVYCDILIMDLRGELQSMNPPINYKGLRFIKNQRGGDQYFLLNIGGASRRKRERKHCFSFKLWNLCSFLTLSFMFIFLLTPFDTSDCCYFESNLSLVLLIKVS